MVTRVRHAIALIVIGLLLIWGVMPLVAQSDEPPPEDTCAAVRYLMERDATPYDLTVGGGVLSDGVTANGAISGDYYADFWSFLATLPRDEFDNVLPFPVTFTFADVTGDLEFALYKGMIPITEFAPLGTTQINIDRDGLYTVVVRRTRMTQTSDATYTLTPTHNTDGALVPPGELVLANSDPINREIPPTAIQGGQQQITMPTGDVFAHAGAIQAVNTRDGTSTQVFFPNQAETNLALFTMRVGPWADDLRFLAGDLALRGADRVYYLQNFSYNNTIDGVNESALNLENITYGDGTQIQMTWEAVQGIWVLSDCAGIKLTTGQTFITPITSDDRNVTFDGPLETFDIAVDAPDGSYNARLDWRNVADEINYRGGVFDIPLISDRDLQLTTRDLILTGDPVPGPEIGRTDVSLNDRSLSLSLDWVNMRSLRVLTETFEIDFTDEPRASLVFSRSTDRLMTVNTINDVLRLQYTENNTTPGEQRMLLPASESYLEIVTPPGQPPFNGQALPGEDGYYPRGLNNTGAECYRVNTILPEANCPPNGYVNPTNGNLFYTITDLKAYGGDNLDLSLTRSYNSRLANIDGLFGRGWSTAYLLDYIVPFDETTLSRLVTPETPYRAGLDVTYAPRGVVVFNTPSGSRHQFVSSDTAFNGGTLRAVTMPGWELSRESYTAPVWRLTQVDGYAYTFDRAGRLLGFETADGSRQVTIDYPGTTITTLDPATEPVVITDSADPTRTLSLYIDAGRVRSAVLADQTLAETDCTLANNCFTTTYTYTDDLLTAVTYPDGTTASYTYDDNGRLIEHDDNRAPIVPHMRYTYDQSGRVGAMNIVDGEQETVYRQYTTTTTNNQLQTTITDDLNNRRTYSYRYTPGTLRRVDNTFTLAQVTSPLAGIDAFEDAPQVYLWEDGLLTRFDTRQLRPGEGRSATSFAYNAYGQVSCIACASPSLPQLQIDYAEDDETGQTLPYPATITYADGSQERFTYDAQGRVQTHTDTFGATYTYTWDDTHLSTRVRQQDNARWDYTYNTVGQLTSITQAHNGNPPHTISYTYDGLGRVTSITDSTLGTYAIEYTYIQEARIAYPQVTITNPVGAVSLMRFDQRGRMVERSLEDAERLLSLVTYDYDAFGRLTTESDWLIDEQRGVPLTTTYDYTRRPTIPPLQAGQGGTVINGTEITVTSPDDNVNTYAYDALGRLRRTEDAFQQRTYYDYFVNDMSGYQWGLRVEQRTLASGSNDIQRIRYLFDGKRQLREVVADSRRWAINLDGSSTRVASVVPQVDNRLVTLQGAFYDEYIGGKPGQMQVRQADLFLNSGFRVINDHEPFRAYEYDLNGDLTTVRDADETPYYTLNCPQGQGTMRVIYTRDQADCNTDAFELALTYDSAGRLVGADDSQGVRVFTYTPDTTRNVWRVEGTFVGEGDTASWSFVYDSAGRILEWTDADGFRQVYTYDTLGRLVRTEIADQPEYSFSFRYDTDGNLIEQQDDLGRGVLYNYNTQGQVISRLDTFTADTTSYSYTPQGLLETVISPGGNTTTYVYDDDADPTRLTGIIEPTGSQHRFEWRDENNLLIYTDPLGTQVRYRYDGNGLLWRIEDPVAIPGIGQRIFEIHYDDNGMITAWLQDSRQGNTSSRTDIEQPQPGTYTVTESPTGWSGSFTLSPSGLLQTIDTTTMQYDALDRPLQLSVGNDQTWAFSRADGSPTITLTSPFDGEVLFQYDAMFRLLSRQTDGETLTQQYTAGLGGAVIVDVTYPNNITEQFVIDPGDARASNTRTVSRTGQGYRVIYFYDSEGLLTQARTDLCSDPTQADINTCELRTTSRSIVYDAVGRPLRIINADGSFEAFTYDEAGNLLTYQTVNGRRFSYVYDEAGYLAYISSPTGVKIIIARNSLSDVVGICRTRVEAPDNYSDCAAAGGELVTYQVDTLRRRTSQARPLLAESQSEVAYRYDPAGPVTRFTQDDLTTNYVYNALGQLIGIEGEGGQVNFGYDGLDTVAETGGVDYMYDALGRLTAAGNFRYAYGPDAVEIYNDQTLALRYGLDSRGLLASLGDDLITFAYPTTQQLTLTRADDVIIQYTTDVDRDVQAVNYSDGGDFAIFHQPDPSGYIRRQTITRPVDGIGYGLALGYDNDDRPLTMRVTDNTGLQVLYTQSLAYDQLGNLIREIRQFDDGTQMILRYEYHNVSQLARQLITIVRPQGEQALSLLVLLAVLAWWRQRRRWRWVGGAVLVIMLAGAVFSPPALLQPSGETYQVAYQYTPTGMVDSLIATLNDNVGTRVECVRYDYDGLNRLTRVRYENAAGEDDQLVYAYDSFNRLVTAGEWTLQYNGTELFALSSATETYYYGGPSGQVDNVLLGSDDSVTWLITDGRERIVQSAAEGANPQPDLWLFDPLRRYLPLEAPSPGFNPCRSTDVPADIPPQLVIQPLANGMIWDARTNLYFDNGRAYDPESGRYLQPDENGPDALGNIYTAYNGRTEPPLVPPAKPYYKGLAVLDKALAQVRLNETLSATAIQARYQPTLSGAQSSLFTNQQAARAPYHDSMQRLQNLPIWLQTAYNVPAPSIQADTGAITMPNNIIPAYHGATDFTPLAPVGELPSWDAELIGGTDAASVSALYAGRYTPQAPLSYIPGTWEPGEQVLTVALMPPALAVGEDYTPSAVLSWLPAPLEAPVQALYTLDYLHELEAMPHQQPIDHVNNMLTETLPAAYDAPSSREAWRSMYFSDDLFSINAMHATPSLPDVPTPVLPGIAFEAD